MAPVPSAILAVFLSILKTLPWRSIWSSQSRRHCRQLQGLKRFRALLGACQSQQRLIFVLVLSMALVDNIVHVTQYYPDADWLSNVLHETATNWTLISSLCCRTIQIIQYVCPDPITTQIRPHLPVRDHTHTNLFSLAKCLKTLYQVMCTGL